MFNKRRKRMLFRLEFWCSAYRDEFQRLCVHSGQHGTFPRREEGWEYV